MRILISFFVIVILVTTVGIGALKPTLHPLVKIDEKIPKTEKKESPQVELKWNNWHSKLLNTLMDESKAPSKLPLGTVIYISFDVDDGQNITNIKVTTEPEKYTQIAKEHFTKHIRNLNGTDVLKFPEDSQRKVAHFDANLQKALTTKYSKPEDFKDTEQIRHSEQSKKSN